MIKEMHVCILPTCITSIPPTGRTQVRSLVHLDFWYYITDNGALGRNGECHGKILDSGFDAFVFSSSKKLFIRSTRQIRIPMVWFKAVSFCSGLFCKTKRCGRNSGLLVKFLTELMHIEHMVILAHNIRKQAFRPWKKLFVHHYVHDLRWCLSLNTL